MGNTSSRNRRSTQEPAPSRASSRSSGPEPHVYYGGLRPLSNGQFHQQTGSRGRGNQRVHQGPPLAPVPRPREIPPPAELRTKTIRNDVNLKKSSLVLLPVEEGSSRYAVEFTFDAAARCYVSIFLNVAEVPSNRCSLHPSKNLCGRRISFGKGLRQKFSLDPEYAIDVSSALEDAEAKPSSNSQDFHNIVIRLETVQSEGEEGHEIDDLPPGSPFPRWVQSQTTYANIVKQDDGHYALRVKKQKIWVQGTSYELQEIYGMEPVMGEAVGDTEDAGQECVICLSEPRDTTVLPCRHMCMCNKCARMLREKSNNCPICRKPVESLLEIKVGRPVQETQVREESMAGTS